MFLSVSDGLTFAKSALHYSMNLTMIPSAMSYNLSGVFLGNKLQLFNVTIWTLPYEVLCYLILLGVSILLREPSWIWRGIVIFLIGCVVVNVDFFLNDFFGKNIELALFFAAGCVLQLMSAKVLISKSLIARLAMLLICIYILSRHIAGVDSLVCYTSFYASAMTILILLAISTKQKWTEANDLSYGMYIYGFFFQQIIAQIYPDLTPVQSLIPTVLITGVAAMLSWRFVESPSLNWFKSLKF